MNAYEERYEKKPHKRPCKQSPCCHRALYISHNAPHRWSSSRYSTWSSFLFVQAITEQTKAILRRNSGHLLLLPGQRKLLHLLQFETEQVFVQLDSSSEDNSVKKSRCWSLPDTEEICEAEKPAERQGIYLCCTVYDFLLDDSNERVIWKMKSPGLSQTWLATGRESKSGILSSLYFPHKFFPS